MTARLEKGVCVLAYVEGWRDVVVIAHGHKYLTGFTASTLERVKLPASVPVRCLNYPRTRLVRRLRRNAKLFAPGREIAATIKAIARTA